MDAHGTMALVLPCGLQLYACLVDFRQPGAVFAVLQELLARQRRAARFVDLLHQTGFDGVLHRDPIVIPAALAGAGFLGELVEQRVRPVVGAPHAEVVAPGDAALRGFPQCLGVGMLGELVQPHVAAEDGHRVRVGGKRDDAAAAVELDIPEFDFLGEGFALVVFGLHLDAVLAAGNDGAGEVENLRKVHATS